MTQSPIVSRQSSIVNKSAYELAKRIIETSLALVILLGFSPLWLGIALAIKLTSAGPVLYRAMVIGKDGKPFIYYKFRSMHHNRDDSKHRHFIHNYVGYYLNNATLLNLSPDDTTLSETETEAAEAAPVEGQFKLLNDERITRIGRLLRKLSLDEIPQLLNVIRGEMAVVGPRPPVPYEYTLYDEACCQRLRVRPGITGLAQVRARGKASFPQMLEMDLEYIQHRSLWLDFKIMLKTPFVMLKGA